MNCLNGLASVLETTRAGAEIEAVEKVIATLGAVSGIGVQEVDTRELLLFLVRAPQRTLASLSLLISDLLVVHYPRNQLYQLDWAQLLSARIAASQNHLAFDLLLYRLVKMQLFCTIKSVALTPKPIRVKSHL